MFGIGSNDFEFRSNLGANTFLLHELGNRVLTACDTNAFDFFMQTRTAIVIQLGNGMNAFDFGHDFGLLEFGIAGRLVKRFVIRSPGHLEDAALRLDGPDIPMLVDEAESQLFSFAKKAVAFFKISRSILSWRFSSRSRFSSASTVLDPATSELKVPSAWKARFQL